MKKLLIISSFLALSIGSSMAQQTNKGTILAGGGLNFNANKSKITLVSNTNGVSNTDKSTGPAITGFTFSPNVGWFIVKGLALGLKSDISANKSKSNDTTITTSSNVSIGPFVRYYYQMGKIAPFFEASFGIGNSKSTDKYSSAPALVTRVKGNVWGFGPGIAVFLNNNIAIEGSMMYKILNSKDNYKVSTGGVNIDYTKTERSNMFLFNIGLQIFLGTK